MLVPDKDAASSAMKKSRDPEQEKKKRSYHPDNHRSCQANTTASSVFSVGPCNTSGQQHDNSNSGQLLPPVTTLLPPSTAAGVVTNRNMPPYPMSDSERPLSIAVTTNRNNRNAVPGVPGGVTVTAVTTIPTTLPQVWPLTQCFMFAFV